MTTLNIDPQFAATLPGSQSKAVAASHAGIHVLERLLAIRAYNGGYARSGMASGCPDCLNFYYGDLLVERAPVAS